MTEELRDLDAILQDTKGSERALRQAEEELQP